MKTTPKNQSLNIIAIASAYRLSQLNGLSDKELIAHLRRKCSELQSIVIDTLNYISNDLSDEDKAIVAKHIKPFVDDKQ